MKLPIHDKPAVNTYIQHAYTNAIIECKELLRLGINNIAESSWYQHSKDTEFIIADNILIIREINYGWNTISAIWRECKPKDEIIITIEYIKNTNTSSFIELMLTQCNDKECIVQDNKLCSILWNRYGVFCNDKQVESDAMSYVFLRLVRDGDSVLSYSSNNGFDWTFVNQISLCNTDNDLQFAILADLGPNQYYDWKYMNYMQLFYNENDIYGEIWLDYYMFPRKNSDYGYQYNCHFIDTCYDRADAVFNAFGTMKKYIQWNIDQFYYVNLCLDEYCISNRKAYQKYHYVHYNLIYGYNIDSEVYYILGVNEFGKIECSEIAFDLCEDERIIAMDIVRFRYNVNVKPLCFNVHSFRQNLYEYINSIDSSLKNSNLLSQRPGIYGLSIFQTLRFTKKGQELITKDKRISYILYEHCNIMKDRLQYLFHKKYIPDNDKEELEQLCKEMVDTSEVLKNIVLKNKISSKNQEEILNQVDKLYQCESSFYNNLYKVLAYSE
jgi:hypothetical protein